MPLAEPEKTVPKPTFIRRLMDRYRWMSLRNKIGLWCLLAALVIGGVSLQWVQPAYRTAKMWFFIGVAEKAVARKDYSAASLAYRKVILSGMENPASWKALAKFLDEVGSPEIINVWERLAKMEPTVAEYRYNQAAASLKFSRVFQAEEILNHMPDEWQASPEGLRIAAEIATRKKEYSVAETALRRLLTLEPSDRKAAFDLLSLEADGSNPDLKAKARRELERIASQESEFTAPALRRLISFSVQDGEVNEANLRAGRLVARRDVTLQDRLMYAQLEATTNSFSLPITLANLRAYAVKHPAEFGVILQWFMNTRLDSTGVARWVAELPPEVRALPEVESSLFPYYLASGDWEKVFALLQNSDSPLYLPPKVLGLASRALEQDRSGETAADQTWQEAVYAAEGQPKTLHILSLLASARGWSGATGRALSALADAAPGEASVWWLLVQHENDARNLPGLYKALEGLMRINPYDIAVASNWVLAGALVRQGDTQEFLKVAKRTYYSTYPSDAQAATAYAIALLQAKRPAEAMKIIDNMTISDRREPKRVIYVGAVLAANGRSAEALEAFTRSEDLLDNAFPEEKTLRAIWKGVAMGEATTAEEAERLLIQRDDPDIQSLKIKTELAGEIKRRSDPVEIQRILTSLKSETEGRRKSPLELEQLMREVRKEPAP